MRFAIRFYKSYSLEFRIRNSLLVTRLSSIRTAWTPEVLDEEILFMSENSKYKSPSWMRKFVKILKWGYALWKFLDFIRRLASDYRLKEDNALQLRTML